MPGFEEFQGVEVTMFNPGHHEHPVGIVKDEEREPWFVHVQEFFEHYRKDRDNMTTQLLPVKLDDAELLIRGHELASACAELEDIEARKKLAMSAFKDEIEAAESNVTRLSRIVKDGKEYRDVEVKEVRNEERMTMDTYRLDSGECVSYRPLQGHERNLTLFPAAVEEPEKVG